MAWVFLGAAVIAEIIWVLSLKWAATKTSLGLAAIPVVLSFVNMALLGLAMRGLPAGTAYPIWTGAGAVGVVLFGAVVFQERVNPAQLGFVSLIIVGVVGTKLFAE